MSYIFNAQKVGNLLLEKKLMLLTVESCTGGGVAKAITDISGSSAYFEAGFVTYANHAKVALGVSFQTIEQYGAVSVEVASEMAQAATKKSPQKIAISITGIAGPTGGTPLKPVGTVCFGLSCGEDLITQKKHFTGNRTEVRDKSVLYALEMLIHYLENKN